MRKRLIAGLTAAGLVLTGLGAVALTADDIPAWAFPLAGSKLAPSPPDVLVRVPGSKFQHRAADMRNMAIAVDWFPGSHPPAPEIVLRSKSAAWACGYCHLPDGQGRPENAALAGLPKAYILTQLRAFAGRARASALPSYAPTAYMITEARSVAPRDWAAVAAYFSQRRFVSRVNVVETSSTPPVIAQGYVYVTHEGSRTPLGARIIETPVSLERFEARDPHVGIIAYVPKGSVRSGAALAVSGGPGGQPCAGCHGAGLKGALGPPLAGRSPSYMFRQLMAFQTGSRHEAEAAPMRFVAARLNQSQMIALAAYGASLTP